MLLVNGEEHRQKHGRPLIPEAHTSKTYRASPAAKLLADSPLVAIEEVRWQILSDVVHSSEKMVLCRKPSDRGLRSGKSA